MRTNWFCVKKLQQKKTPFLKRMPLERVMGIEPTYPAWKAGVLPLNYTRNSQRRYNTTLVKICQQIFLSIIGFYFALLRQLKCCS